MTMPSSPEPLLFSAKHQVQLSAYLPPSRITYLEENASSQTLPSSELQLPHVTLTYATSLDSQISLQPGIQTILSGPETKAMTHYLRSQHDAILVGAGTAEADNPGLNSRFSELGDSVIGLDRQPRPFILDPGKRLKLQMTPKLTENARMGIGRAAWWIIGDDTTKTPESGELHAQQNLIMAGHYNGSEHGVDWKTILTNLAATGVRSIMIEGGATVINDLLREKNQKFISSIIVTIAPTYLGSGGVVVSPPRSDAQKNEARLGDVKWLPFGQDVVMAGKLP